MRQLEWLFAGLMALTLAGCAFGVGMQFGKHSRQQPGMTVTSLDPSKYIMYMNSDGNVVLSRDFVMRASDKIREKEAEGVKE